MSPEFQPFGFAMTTSSIIKKDIQAALTELGKDREVFERVEISPEAMQRSVEKYGQLIPSALFDFWFDMHKSDLYQYHGQAKH